MNDDKDMVSKELLRKMLHINLESTNNAKQVLKIEEDEPVMYDAIQDLCGMLMQALGEQYPLITKQQPRIFSDFMSVGQLLFIKGYTIGREVMREQFDGFFESINREPKDESPESDLKNFT